MGFGRSWITLPLPLLMLSLAAQAQESSPGRALVAQPSPTRLDTHTTPADREERDFDLETRAWGQLYLNKNGLELRQPIELGERRLEFGVKGPLMKRKRVGLAFELRF